ncbi:MAG: hypothetical protein U0792_13265 [Gemmataceae bacterium]
MYRITSIQMGIGNTKYKQNPLVGKLERIQQKGRSHGTASP